MSKEKQIEEMAHDLCHWWNGTGCTFGMVGKKAFFKPKPCRLDCNSFIDAERLYNAGYRKQNEPISCGHEKGGEWTKHLDEWDCEYAKCSCCGEEFYDSSGEDTIDMFYKFCPNCGARMKGGAG